MEYSALLNRLSRRGSFRIKPGLERVSTVLTALGNPQDKIRSIHIAGTNGKGSVAACLESVLRHAGYRTGLYTSPHLQDIRERIQIDRLPISVGRFSNTARTLLDAERQTATTLTYFEFLTVMAYQHFVTEAVDVAIMEVGMGGRWDATNVMKRPSLTVITSIGLDHTQWLGRTETAIAREKAGILKAGSPLVSGARGRAARVIAKLADSKGIPLFQLDKDFRARNLAVGLPGRYQMDNTALVLAGLAVLRDTGWTIPESAITQGLKHVSWPGRFHVIASAASAPILFDGAHNPPAMKHLLDALDHSLWKKARKVFVFSAYKDKDYRHMLRMLRPHATQMILCTMPGKRALSARAAASAVPQGKRPMRIVSDPHKALQAALQMTRKNDLVVVTGSFTLVGRLLPDLTGASRAAVHTIASPREEHRMTGRVLMHV